jgi:hypothetical protein
MLNLYLKQVFENFSLITWNSDLFSEFFFKLYYEYFDLVMCRLTIFAQNVSIQSLSWILTLMSVDRFIFMSKADSFCKRLPFGTSATVYFWSIAIFFVISAFNFNVLLLPEFLADNKTNNTGFLNVNSTYLIDDDEYCNQFSSGYKSLQNWQDFQVYYLSVLPIVLILIINILIIIKIFQNSKLESKSIKKHISITLSIISITYTFILMNLPAMLFSIIQSDSKNVQIGDALNFMAFLNHGTLFFNSMLTNYKFRKEFFKILNKIRF